MMWGKKRSFVGQHVCITGGSEGLGLSLALLFVEEGANVSIISRTVSKLEAAHNALVGHATSCGKTSVKTCWKSCDVCNHEELQDAINGVQDELGPVHVMVANAGFSYPGRFLDTKMAVFKSMMETNYLGSVATVQAVAPDMVKRRSGSIVLISSAAGVVGLAGYAAYSPTKWALRGFADCLRMEMQAYGVEVHIAYPPDMLTPGYAENELDKCPPEMEDMKDFLGDKAIEPKDVAKAIISGLKKGKYHLPSPDFLQTISQSSMASLSPIPFCLPFQMLISGVAVPLCMYFTNAFDKIVRKHQGVEKEKSD